MVITFRIKTLIKVSNYYSTNMQSKTAQIKQKIFEVLNFDTASLIKHLLSTVIEVLKYLNIITRF